MKKISVHPSDLNLYCHDGTVHSTPRDLNDKDYFTCPMHPSVRRHSPGFCPECGMALEPLIDQGQEKNELKSAWWNFSIAVFFTMLIVPLAMDDMLFGSFFHNLVPPSVLGLLQLLFSLPVCLWAAWPLYERGLWSVWQFRLNMFSLVSIGVLLSFIYSAVATLIPGLFPHHFLDEAGQPYLYFEAAGAIVSLVWLGQILELKARDRTSSALRALLGLRPVMAHLVHPNGDEQDIEIDLVKAGDILRVLPGETIPIDGRIVEGKSAINEAMISGEPMPVEKKSGDSIIGGTLNTNEMLLIEAQKSVQETVLAQIIALVSEAQRSRAHFQSFADKLAQILVPMVIVISLVSFFAWLFFGPEPQLQWALLSAISVLMIACPCALGLATPMSVMVAIGRGAQAGIYFKNAQALEEMAQITTIVLDKTGTLTQGKASLVGIEMVGAHQKKNVIKMAASIAKNSQHPLSLAIVRYAMDKESRLLPVEKFSSQPGLGLAGEVAGHRIILGNRLFLEQQGVDLSILDNREEPRHEKAFLMSFVAMDGHLAALLAFEDEIKENAVHAINYLKKRKLRIILASGDSLHNTQRMAEKFGISEIYGSMTPLAKANLIESLQRSHAKVAMVGDGINDAPALARSNVGIAMGNGTEVAMGTAHISLLKGELELLVRAHTLARRALNNIKQNLFWAFFYNILGIPIAAGILYPSFGILLHPMIAAAAMSLSSFSVIVNALRLRTVKL